MKKAENSRQMLTKQVLLRITSDYAFEVIFLLAEKHSMKKAENSRQMLTKQVLLRITFRRKQSEQLYT
ncbi:hypothetical protein GCM10010911_27150 [Paenibacillus nasutitermitis]|uniref:Uncharacterized protein n=1 Tax=Paenibacillus nasutitermitis TaxID=1652958 RepID=A0A916YZ47_9BACL|nr:hypothetical protein GCM10010911_27150 [Paenibacillus nasutitermitis]